MAEDFQKRQVAYKTRITDILSSPYMKEEGWNPNYLVVRGVHVSRINLIATIVSVSGNPEELIVDDGTGTIKARSFAQGILQDVKEGELVLLIARPREVGADRYLAIETLKKLNDRRWAIIRDLEIRSLGAVDIEPSAPAAVEVRLQRVEDIEEITLPKENPFQKIFNIIRQLDKGEGADITQVIAESGQPNAEQVINDLLKEGEIFEVKRGRVKVLE